LGNKLHTSPLLLRSAEMFVNHGIPPTGLLYVYTVARIGKRWEEKKRIERLLYVHDMDMNYSCIGFNASAIAATRLRIFRALASCDGAAE
ncbi:hypothetical protein O5626_28885, partial [Escherichia coli]|nr:hypothetical protein [Escherichia coli]